VADGAPSLGHEGEGAFSLPGSAAETHSGMPEGPVRAWTRPAWWCAFPEYHLSISVPFLLVFLSEQRSEAMRVPSRIR
jgi:hypothetical protein